MAPVDAPARRHAPATTTLVAALMLLAASPVAHAQLDSSIGVGVAVTLYEPVNQRADHPTGFGLVGRLRRGSGLGATVGLDWFTSDVQTAIDGEPAPLGTMSVRPLMAGVSYIKQYRRYAVSAGLVAGWSFNSIGQTGVEQAAYRERVAMADARLAISDCVTARPDITLWYELGHHFAASASVSYMYARPTITTVSGHGRRTEVANLSATVVTFGVVYGVF